MFHTVLVANRGEIALRVFRTCRDLGIRTVAVFTEADADAPHVRDADLAVPIGSYLDAEEVVAAAIATGAEAIHPGYGFLSERAELVLAAEKAGIVFVGPSAEVMEQMGRKDAAREIAVAAGVPVVPSFGADSGGLDTPSLVPRDGYSTSEGVGGVEGVAGRVASASERIETAAYPLLVKAAAGGGGKGMRIVRDPADLEEAKAAAAREARSAFGDDTLLIEKYVERGRHLEVQVFADSHGNVIHLYERDCSAQRRHQKVIEEAPAPGISDELRATITGAAVALARQVGYVGAGTVEFLLDEATGQPYFLEMNTRLQVEHPVTEAIIGGADLVAEQFRVAAGGELTLRQEAGIHGHAMEARVYAEDPYAGFLPQAGTATLVRWPTSAGRVAVARDERGLLGTTTAAVRVDHALESGQVVSTAYDPMLGKIIVHGPDRESARRALIRALDDTVIFGLTTNTGFLRALAASDAFRDAGTANGIDTAWLDRHADDLPAPTEADEAEARRLAAWAWYLDQEQDPGPFRADGFRIGGPPAPIRIELDETVALTGHAPHELHAYVHSHQVELVHQGQRYVFARPDVFADHAVAGDGTITAPMPGTVLDVRVAAGQQVAEGDVLGVLEAMKMEVALRAPFAGVVTSAAAVAGAQVALGATLFVVEVSADE